MSRPTLSRVTPHSKPCHAPQEAEPNLPTSVMRELEVKVVEFTDSLEPLGKPKEWVAMQVAEQRRQLVLAAQEGLVASKADAKAKQGAKAEAKEVAFLDYGTPSHHDTIQRSEMRRSYYLIHLH